MSWWVEYIDGLEIAHMIYENENRYNMLDRFLMFV